VIRRQVVIPVTPERLWQALTDPEQIAGWFGGHLQLDLEEGGRAWFHGDDGHERLGRVEAVRPGRHLRFRWWPVADDEGSGAGVSEVSYLLEPVEEGTRLTIQERQLTAPDSDRPRASAAGHSGRGTTAGSWSAWDERLAGAWLGLAVRAFEGAGA
jgi:uncharacterized protein YndB with AHSA1/START domain